MHQLPSAPTPTCPPRTLQLQKTSCREPQKSLLTLQKVNLQEGNHSTYLDTPGRLRARCGQVGVGNQSKIDPKRHETCKRKKTYCLVLSSSCLVLSCLVLSCPVLAHAGMIWRVPRCLGTCRSDSACAKKSWQKPNDFRMWEEVLAEAESLRSIRVNFDLFKSVCFK